MLGWSYNPEGYGWITDTTQKSSHNHNKKHHKFMSVLYEIYRTCVEKNVTALYSLSECFTKCLSIRMWQQQRNMTFNVAFSRTVQHRFKQQNVTNVLDEFNPMAWCWETILIVHAKWINKFIKRVSIDVLSEEVNNLASIPQHATLSRWENEAVSMKEHNWLPNLCYGIVLV